jgi:hypothetical protein
MTTTTPSTPATPYAKLLPLIREQLWAPDGKPPEAWDERREASVLKRLLVHRSVSQIETAIFGLRQLRDTNQIVWLHPGDKVTTRALYCSRAGVSQVFELATRAYWESAKKKVRPHDWSSVGSVLFHSLRQTSEYREYMRSPAWRACRQRALGRAGGKCERCASPRSDLDVHHLRYDSLGHEPDADVVVLCWACHAKADRERLVRRDV